jgi:hypothetical protein
MHEASAADRQAPSPVKPIAHEVGTYGYQETPEKAEPFEETQAGERFQAGEDVAGASCTHSSVVVALLAAEA